MKVYWYFLFAVLVGTSVLYEGLTFIYYPDGGFPSISNLVKKEIKTVEENEVTETKETEFNNQKPVSYQEFERFVKGKSIRECLKELKTTVIDNAVVECNKDRFTKEWKEINENN